MAKKSIFSRKVNTAPTRTKLRINVSNDDIATRAYYIWEQEGRPSGREMDFWFRAEKQLCSSAR